MFRILIDDLLRRFSNRFSNKYESNTINKRINGPPILLSKQRKKKRGIVTALPLPSGEKKSHFCENPEATVTFVRAAI
jgi:hypothetical protein